MKRTGFAKILALGLVLVTVLGVLPLVMADDNWNNWSIQVEISDNGYSPDFRPGPDYYIPGDPVEIRIWCWDNTPPLDGLNDVFDILIFDANDPFPLVFDDRVGHFNDVSLDANGEAFVSYELTKSLADGTYDVYVGPEDWYENGAAPWGNPVSTSFHIQLYTIQATTDRTGYVPGDMVTVFYSVVSIKDGSLITEEAYDGSSFDGQWHVESGDGDTSEGPTSYSDSSGNFDFQIFPQGSVGSSYFIYIYFNGTYGSTREQATRLDGNAGFWHFVVGGLGLTVGLDRPDYQIGSVVKATIRATVSGSGEPDAEVKIEVLEGTGVSASKISGLGGTFQSDATGYVVYAFTVDSADFDEDETYTVRVNVSKHLKAAEVDRVFDVVAGGRTISVNMVFDEEVYASGDTISVDVQTALPAGASAVSSYSYTVKVVVAGPDPTVWQEASDSNFFSYDVPDNFEGTLRFEVRVYNPDGDSGQDMETRNVHHAILLINAEPERYEAGDTIEANFELITNREMGIDETNFYFVVTDNAGDIVLEGETSEAAGSFEYTVPNVASSRYTFNIYANLLLIVGENEYKVWVESSDTCTLKSGYDVEIWMDNPTYSPGDRVGIHYKITPISDEGLPDKFVFFFVMSNGQTYTWQSESEEGTIYYKLPGGVNEGDIWVSASVSDGDGNFIGGAGEIMNIQDGASALEWTRALDVPLFSWILLLLIILLIIFMLFRRPAAAAPEKAPAEAAPEPAPVEEEMVPVAPEEESPLSINCKSCGAEIEITTSKRPIEVMCPSCGETEMVE
jgi:hypothetical protein